MTKFTVEFKPSAEKQFRKLPDANRLRIAGKIDALQTNPFPAGCKKLSAREGIYRIRVGKDRVLCTVDSNEMVVLVVGVGPRGTIYR